MKKALLLLSLLVLTVSLTACGGSSGSSDSTPPASLTGAVVAAPISGMDIYIGSEYTTADQDLKIGVTNATGAIEFIPAVVAQIDEYPVVIETRGTGKNIKTKGEFNYALSAIMMSKTDSVYLTPFGTIAARIFEKKNREINVTAAAAATYAKDAVKALVKDTFGSSVNPFANPLANSEVLMQHEILTQSLMLTLDVDETVATTTAADHFDGYINDIVEADAIGETYRQVARVHASVTGGESIATYLNNNPALVAQKVATTLTELTDDMSTTERDAKLDAMKLKAQGAIVLASQTAKNLSIVATVGDSKYVPTNIATDIIVKVNTNQATAVSDSAKFKITYVPENGVLKIAAGTGPAIIAGDTEYDSDSSAQFKFTPVADTKDEYTFNFETIPTDGEKVLKTTLTLSAREADTVIPTAVELNSTEKLFGFATGDAVVDTIDKDATFALNATNLTAEVIFDAITGTVAKAAVNAAMAVEFTAPEGFAFKNTANEIEKSILAHMVAANVGSNKATFQLPAAEYTLVVTNEDGVDADKLSFVVKAVPAADVTTTDEVPFRSTRDAKIVLCEAGTENTIQSISIAKEIEIDAIALKAGGDYTHTFDKALIKVAAVTWNSTAGKTATFGGFTAAHWSAKIVTPTVTTGADYQTGFYNSGVKGSLTFATAASGAMSGANATNEFSVKADTIPFTFATDVSEATVKFVYDPSTAEGDELKTNVFTVENGDYVKPEVATVEYTTSVQDLTESTDTAFTVVATAMKVTVNSKSPEMMANLTDHTNWSMPTPVVVSDAFNGTIAIDTDTTITATPIAGEDAYTVSILLKGTSGDANGKSTITLKYTKETNTQTSPIVASVARTDV